MAEGQALSQLEAEHDDRNQEHGHDDSKREYSMGNDIPQAAAESSAADAIIDAGRIRALKLANFFAAQAEQAAGVLVESSKRKRDDCSVLEAPDLKRPAGDVVGLKLAADPTFAISAPLLAMDGNATETIMCPPDKVGRIIGRAGATIRDLEASTSTRIQVDHKAPGDKPVVVSGRRDDVDRAKRAVHDLISGATETTSPSTNEVQGTVECPPGIVGRIIGRGGETIRTLQQASGAHILVNQDFPEGVPRQIIITGAQDAVQRATSMVSELINGSNHTNTQAIIQRFGVGSTEVVECPKAMVGRIIGKGGETIKDLQKRFNVSIQIDQGSTPCKVTITGPSPLISSARRSIEELIRTPSQPSGGGIRPGPSFTTSYTQPNYTPYGAYGGFAMPQAVYPAHSGYQPYGGYSPYPNTMPTYASYSSVGAASDPYASVGNYSQSHYTASVSQQNAGPTTPGAAGNSSLWQILQDDQGRNYYYNSLTGVSQWEKPADVP
ncbi:subunit of circadian RNA-binding protein [Volvox carteri f. nagariensis]|uniref:CRB1f n=1 Tax=Volvox carteri f. nagariensis TaxID=3068 RepID=D8UH03_VOLCA|nr:subunit of circadian RNA-binding protein [Volvox carteri f. nagariensis]ADI46875.1 CRB1f [Volvox carteri f. nagariensis]EFJ40988.1 subunit of circadian RNA-binding protein [Volvox carteri f. nagariensis]|eukprot:XP_002957962.1 subunit of circadian RNA-binding protein [Volvox carteri f. nagariensis]